MSLEISSKKIIKVRDVEIGNVKKIPIQSMTSVKTTDVNEVIIQVENLTKIGCDIVRVSIPCKKSAIALKTIVPASRVPIVADVHYDPVLAVEAIKNGASKLRINPSNFPTDSLKYTLDMAKEYKIPIRVGVNQGSTKQMHSGVELAEYALKNVLMLEKKGFEEIVISAKSSNVNTNIQVYRYLNKRTNYPLHIGLTEAGGGKYAEVKSLYALGILLSENIGDTIRISLTGHPEREVLLAQYLLQAAGRGEYFSDMISCPTCARSNFSVDMISREIEKYLKKNNKIIKVAIMGCAVNGVGEAMAAQIGVCGGNKKSSIYVDGQLVEIVRNDRLLEQIVKYVDDYAASGK